MYRWLLFPGDAPSHPTRHPYFDSHQHPQNISQHQKTIFYFKTNVNTCMFPKCKFFWLFNYFIFWFECWSKNKFFIFILFIFRIFHKNSVKRFPNHKIYDRMLTSDKNILISIDLRNPLPAHLSLHLSGVCRSL